MKEHFAKNHLTSHHLNPLLVQQRLQSSHSGGGPTFQFGHARRDLGQDVLAGSDHTHRSESGRMAEPEKRLPKRTPSKAMQNLELSERESALSLSGLHRGVHAV